MELTEIRNINQKIYELDTGINRNSKVIFIASLIICYKLNKDFRKSCTSIINFVDKSNSPIDQIVKLTKNEISNKYSLKAETQKAIFDSLDTIVGANTKLAYNRNALCNFIEYFISKCKDITPNDLFLHYLYMEIDKKAKNKDKGIVLTPVFVADLMTNLLKLDYKKDIILDLCCGTGIFSILTYSKMIENLNNHKITNKEYDKYKKRLHNSIIAGDIDPKMVTLCFTNFLISDLNTDLIYYKDVHTLEPSSFKLNGKTIQATKAILNPPYEDESKPIDIIEKNISLVKNNENENLVVAIIPPLKFSQNKEEFYKILNISTLETAITMQDDLFRDSGTLRQKTSIFVFNTSKKHNENYKIPYYNFTDSGYKYVNAEGLKDQYNTFENKKDILLKKISNKIKNDFEFDRTWTNFYETNKNLDILTKINPDKVRTNKEEADITFENSLIKNILAEKEKLSNSVNNRFIDEDGSFENYIINIISED